MGGWFFIVLLFWGCRNRMGNESCRPAGAKRNVACFSAGIPFHSTASLIFRSPYGTLVGGAREPR